MPTQLTNPEVKVAVTHATVDAWTLTIARNPDLSVDLTRSTFAATVHMRDADGTILDTRDLSRQAAALPPALLVRIRALQTELIATLRGAGLLPPGNDSPDV